MESAMNPLLVMGAATAVAFVPAAAGLAGNPSLSQRAPVQVRQVEPGDDHGRGHGGSHSTQRHTGADDSSGHH
jgi:hypothetical protein